MKKLYICGLQGQGKGLLAQLLDGHPEIFLPGFIWCPGISLLGDDFTSLLKHTAELRDGKQEVLAQDCTAGDVTIKIEDHTYTISVGTLWRYLFKQNFSAFLIDSFYSDWSNLYAGWTARRIKKSPEKCPKAKGYIARNTNVYWSDLHE